MNTLSTTNSTYRLLLSAVFTVISVGLLSSAAIAAKKGVKAVELSMLDPVEASHLTFMREEEKLARDVYLFFADMYPDQPTFSQIATQSEQTHTDTLRDSLADFGLPDPNPTANDLPASQGVFTGEEWGWYFTDKYAEFTTRGSKNELAALYVGALIEELDMRDIAVCPVVMMDAGYPEPCGLEYTDESALINTYSHLIDGSENHLRAFVGQIEAVIGEGSYEAQYLSQQEVDVILGRSDTDGSDDLRVDEADNGTPDESEARGGRRF